MTRHDGMRKRSTNAFSLSSFPIATAIATVVIGISMTTTAFAITRRVFPTVETTPNVKSNPSSDSYDKFCGCKKLRDALSGDFPEIENVYSDAYLDSVAGVPNRTIEHAIHKMERSLKWRRKYDVESLLSSFEAIHQNGTRIFVQKESTATTSKTTTFEQLVEVCASGAFFLVDQEIVLENGDRRLVVYADTSKLNWWKTGVDAGLRYHVLVLEDAFARITNENRNDTKSPLEESLLLCVDTTNPPLLPPPLGALRGMVRLLQTAYPDRIHKVCVGPVSPWLRGLYAKGVKPFLKSKMQQKIVLLGEAPSRDILSQWFPSNESIALK